MSWSNFATDVESRIVPRSGCGVCKLLAELSEDDVVQVRAVLDNPAFSTRAIYDAFRARGYAIGRDVISVHRRGSCK